MIYFDAAATTLQKPPQVRKMAAYAMEHYASPGRGGYRAAMLASDAVYDCRKELAELFEAKPEDIVFTMNATHALNLAIKTLVSPGDEVVISGFEHNAVWRPLVQIGANVKLAGRKIFDPDDTLEEFRALVDAMWDQNNEWAIKEGGCRLLCILDIGYRQLTTSAKHPVRKLEDAKGIKIRTPQNALMVSTFKALGLEPTAVSFSETFNALQQGVVDGQEGCFNNVVTLKFYEAQKYATMINYSVHSCNFVAGERWLQSLPEKERNALIRAGREAMLYERTKVAGMLEADDKLMREHGMELLGVVEDLPEWVRLGRTAWPKCYDVIGDGDAAKGRAVMEIVLAEKDALARK